MEAHPHSYQQVTAALQGGDLLRQGAVTLVRISTPTGTVEQASDLPWAFGRYRWMLPFLLCLEKHGKEDCMCWKGSKGDLKSAYIGWRKTERLLLLSHPAYKAAWEREKALALANYIAAHGPAPAPDVTIPWALPLLEKVRMGYSPSGAAKLLGKSRFCVTSARQRHPWFNRALIELGCYPRPWKAQFAPARRTK